MAKLASASNTSANGAGSSPKDAQTSTTSKGAGCHRCPTTKGIRLHHDNVRPHVSRQTTALLDKFGWKLLAHAPYSPDLAPSDFHLFLKLKQHLGGQRFNTDEEVKEAVSKFIDGLAAEFFEEGFQKWITRQEKCVEKSGDNVEK